LKQVQRGNPSIFMPPAVPSASEEPLSQGRSDYYSGQFCYAIVENP
jgi:hypothetical protein